MFITLKKPTLKDWLKWAKKTKVDQGVIGFVKKNGIQSARLALRMHDIFKDLQEPGEKELFIGGTYNV